MNEIKIPIPEGMEAKNVKVEDGLWVARDKNGNLFLYAEKPPKTPNVGVWGRGRMGSNDYYFIPKNLLPSIKWADEEPTKVKLVIVE